MVIVSRISVDIMFARVTFLPTLAYNLLRNRWTAWNWYDRIDDTVVLGALPFHGPVTQRLIRDENIQGVISMNEDFELRYGVSNREHWQSIGISFLQLNTPDILHAPAQDKLDRGVEFILAHQKRLALPEDIIEHVPQSNGRTQWSIPLRIQNDGKFLDEGRMSTNGNNHLPSIYVHCKAGRTRSATLVACYLIKRYGLTPEESVHFISKRRPQVFLHTKQWQAIKEFFKRHGTQPGTGRQELRINKETNLNVK